MSRQRPVNAATGPRIRWLREAYGKSQQSLALSVEVDQTAISQYERGLCMPAHVTLQRLADYFDVSLDYLLGRAEERKNLNV